MLERASLGRELRLLRDGASGSPSIEQQAQGSHGATAMWERATFEREIADLYGRGIPFAEYEKRKPAVDVKTAGSVMWEIIRILRRQSSAEDADPDRSPITERWYVQYKPLLKEWHQLVHGVRSAKGRVLLQGVALNGKLETTFALTMPLLEVLKSGSDKKWARQLTTYFYPEIAKLEFEAARTTPEPPRQSSFAGFDYNSREVTRYEYLSVVSRQKSSSVRIKRGASGYGVGEAKAGDRFDTGKATTLHILWTNGDGVFFWQDGKIHAQNQLGFSQDVLVGSQVVAGQNAAGSAILAQLFVETILSFTPWGFIADGVLAFKAVTEGDWKGAGLQLLPGIGGKGLSVAAKTRAGRAMARRAAAAATITARFVKGTVRFIGRGAYRIGGKLRRGVWTVGEVSGKRVYNFFDEGTSHWHEKIPDGRTYIKCSTCQFTPAGKAAAVQVAVDEIVEELISAGSAYTGGGKLLVNRRLIERVVKIYWPDGDHIVELINQTWMSAGEEAVKLFDDTMKMAVKLGRKYKNVRIDGVREVFEDLARNPTTARGTMFELRWAAAHAEEIKALGIPVARGNWEGKGLDVLMRSGEAIELKFFDFRSPYYLRDADRAVAKVALQVKSRLNYKGISKVTVVFSSHSKMPVGFLEKLKAAGKELEKTFAALPPETNKVVKVLFDTWPP